jgi:predicted RNA-binding Zn-ribbon protein involved in translation (DUF1610 family)
VQRSAFQSLREQFRREWSRNHSVIAWSAIAIFCAIMAASLTVEPPQRWSFAVAAAVGLLGLLVFSANINARLLRDTKLKCPNCRVMFFEERANVVMASGNCPECGFQVITESSPLAMPDSAGETRSSRNSPSSGSQ